MSDEDRVPPRRRIDDLPASTAELILYQLSELKTEVAKGFEKMEGRFDRVEDRVGHLERFRERQEERDRAEAATSGMINARWVPLLIAAVTVVVTIILFVIGTGNGPA